MGDVRWIKICTDMAKNKKIKRIRKMPDGDRVVLIWVMLLLQSGDSNRNGGLYLTDTMPFTAEDLAIEFDFDLDLMKMALSILAKFEMIIIFDEIIFIKNWNEYQNIQGLDKIKEQTRERVARHRQQKKLESGNGIINKDVTQCNVTCNKDVTLRNAIELEEELEKEKTSTTKNIINNTNNVNQKTSSISPESYYTKNFNPLITPAIADKIKSYIDDGFEPELLIKAMEITKLNEKPFSYSLGILRNCADNNIKTLVQFEKKSKEFKQKKENRKEAPDMSNYNPNDWRIPNVDSI